MPGTMEGYDKSTVVYMPVLVLVLYGLHTAHVVLFFWF